MIVRIEPSRRVVCSATIRLPLTAGAAWGQLRHFRHFAAMDHFHAAVHVEGDVPRIGAKLVIEHRYGPFRVRRLGRILRWCEGEGFAFSDLSNRHLRAAFPHVMAVSVRPIDVYGCELIVRVTGRWTAPTPRWLGRLWLRWVMLSIGQKMRNELLMFAAVQRKMRCVIN